MRFEYFLQLLKNANFMIGNSSAGVREAPHFGVPTINIGSRQNNRVTLASIANINFDENQILNAIQDVDKESCKRVSIFGDGNSSDTFYKILQSTSFWSMEKQKFFVDLK
jgi:UDP-N-acetylglucosamine 2-epimerase (hydrolysing)